MVICSPEEAVTITTVLPSGSRTTLVPTASDSVPESPTRLTPTLALGLFATAHPVLLSKKLSQLVPPIEQALFEGILLGTISVPSWSLMSIFTRSPLSGRSANQPSPAAQTDALTLRTALVPLPTLVMVRSENAKPPLDPCAFALYPVR